MVKILDLYGQDLSLTAPAQVEINVQTPQQLGTATVNCIIAQTDSYAIGNLTGMVYWDDGSLPQSLTGTGPLPVNLTRPLPVGFHVVRVTATDFSIPTPNKVAANFRFNITVAGGTPPSSVVYGPILPKDDGFPNSSQWNFNTGKDVEILASSVKMLLTTAKGTRIMLPEYGTNLRSVLFEAATQGLESLVQQEIATALATWEPRVETQFLSVVKISDREYQVYATFLSRITQETFPLNLTFS